MSGVVPAHEVVVVRQDDAEMPGGPPVTGRLYADSSATGGALSSQRITLANGAAGATPHHRTGSSELFYVLSGSAELLAGERVRTARQGDLVVVPPGTVHAFAAAPATDADLLIIITPGVERFEYFRHLQRIMTGEVPLESILEVQDCYDNHFDQSRPGSRHSPPAYKHRLPLCASPAQRCGTARADASAPGPPGTPDPARNSGVARAPGRLADVFPAAGPHAESVKGRAADFW